MTSTAPVHGRAGDASTGPSPKRGSRLSRVDGVGGVTYEHDPVVVPGGPHHVDPVVVEGITEWLSAV
ncbi:hypothetical protein [Saccharothrix deserti]|uniref:hypothetical protein n=1 Tax=Saccharothrix deserti TaxID=2593674 RepID=UPI00131DFD93|nr:hypothetical protein [Saccharothrix deserti]